MSVERVKIWIDPELGADHKPEIHWVWRLLLSGMGWAWEEVADSNDAEIAYTHRPEQLPVVKLCVRADWEGWRQVNNPQSRLKDDMNLNGFVHPRFLGEITGEPLLDVVDGRRVCLRDIVQDVFWIVTGQEERFLSFDRHGFFDLEALPGYKQHVVRMAVASRILTWLESTLCEMGFPSPVPRWPGGNQAAASVGHDVDYPEIVRWLEPYRALGRLGGSGVKPAIDVLLGARSHWCFRSWVELEKELSTRGAFYFVPRKGSILQYATGTPDPFYDIREEKFRELFRYLIEEGFEIGMQASYNAYSSREMMLHEKQFLERASGQEILGNRHHYWHLNPADPESTLLLHEEVGFHYDMSLIHDHYLGWRRGMSIPYMPYLSAERRELRTLQMPIAWMDNQLFGLKKFNPGDREEILKELVHHAVEQGGSIFVDIHEYVYDDVLYPGWSEAFRTLWTTILARGDFWIASPLEISNHWRERYRAILSNSHGLKGGLSFEH